MPVLIDELAANISPYSERLANARARVTEPIEWYPYDILSNLHHLDRLLPPSLRDIRQIAGGMPIADIGAADGDLAFTLEHAIGCQVDIVDTASTNNNGLQGARLLKKSLDSSVEIHDVNLDEQFRLPRDRYGLIMMLGILYHLQNPFYVLKRLASQTRYLALSTRVARFAGNPSTFLDELSVAYLVAADEMNGDPTNYWIFSNTGLERIVDRAGWNVVERMNVGDTAGSRPDSNEHDERVFMLLETRHAA